MLRTSNCTLLSLLLVTVYLIASLFTSADAWTTQPLLTRRKTFPSNTFLQQSSSALSVPDEDDEEYEYVEYDSLQEQDFAGSEWLVGTNLDSRPDKIQETWVRLVVTEDGGNLAVWGDNSEGKWALDVASQFFSISKESIFGKKIWAGVVDDYYYLQGTVRGWMYWSPAAVLGQWQARRLGVDKEEAGTPPWFEEEQADNVVES